MTFQYRHKPWQQRHSILNRLWQCALALASSPSAVVTDCQMEQNNKLNQHGYRLVTVRTRGDCIVWLH